MILNCLKKIFMNSCILIVFKKMLQNILFYLFITADLAKSVSVPLN